MKYDEGSSDSVAGSNFWPVSVGFAVAVLVLALAAWSALRSTQRLVDADRRSSDAHNRIAQLAAVLDAATDAETGSRGYVITGNAEFLKPYERGIATASEELDDLEALYVGDSLRRPLLQRVRAALEMQVAHMSRTVELRRTVSGAAAARLVATGRGRELTDAVRSAINDLVSDERAVLARERDELDAATAAATRTLIIKGVIAVVLLALAFGALLVEGRRRRAASAESRELNRTLETRIEQVRADLERTEARFRHALDGLFEGCALLDFDLRFLYTNPAWARQARMTVDAMVGQTLLEIFPALEDSALIAAMRRTLGQRVAQEVELEFTFPDGTTGWFELHIQPVPEGLFALSFETTARVKAERARAASEGRLRALLESLPEQVFVLDRDGVVLDLHIPLGAATLAHPQTTLGRPLAAALDSDAAQRVATAIRQVVDTGVTQTIQYEVAITDRRSQCEAVIVATEGDRVTVVVRDITVRNTLEEQLRQAQKMEAVGQLTGGIAHDFNNVLTIIGSNAELLAMSGGDRTAVSEELREIQAATRRGAEMIARLLMFSRRGLLVRKRIELRSVIREFSPMLSRLLPAYIRLEIGPLDAAEIVNLDAGALEQVIANLCTNARDAMPSGGTLRIKCQSTWLDAGYHATHPWVKPGPYVCVSVTDTGAGMDEKTRQKIFEPFFTTKPTGVGTGLGMAMVYGMMNQHEGMVHVYSEVGKGTEVKLYFPVAKGTPSTGGAKRNSNPGAVAGGTECLLVAEDEPAIRLASRRALESKGYEVIDAADGEQALQLWRENRDRVALVVSDLVMPNLGGLQLAQALRAAESDVPVIFTSGYSTESVLHDGELPPDVQFLHKPWTLSQLFSLVRSALDARTAQG